MVFKILFNLFLTKDKSRQVTFSLLFLSHVVLDNSVHLIPEPSSNHICYGSTFRISSKRNLEITDKKKKKKKKNSFKADLLYFIGKTSQVSNQ